MRSLILIFILFGLVGMISPAYSQLNANNLTQYPETDGNNINAVISDQYGFIWLGTANGLIRFDGYEFTRFYNDPNDSTSISQILIFALYEDSNGRIWIGSVEDINVYDPATGFFTSYPFSDMFDLTNGELPTITTITENSNGTIYFGVGSFYFTPVKQGLLYYDEESDSIQKVSGSAIENIQDVSSSTSDLFGNSWFAGSHSIIQIDKDGKDKNIIFPPLDNNEPNQNPVIHHDNNGMIWISFEPSLLYKYNPKVETYEEFRLNKFIGTSYEEIIVLSINSDPRGPLWVATDKGVFQFDESRSLLTGFPESPDNSLQKSVVSSLNTDAFGNIWLGTYSYGLLKYEEKSYFGSVRSSLDDNSAITPGWVNSFYESSDGTIWFPTAGFGNISGLNKIDPQTGAISGYLYSELFDNPFGVTDIDTLSDNNLLLSTYSGLFSLNTKTLSTNRVETPGIPDSLALINRYHKDRVGTEWIATASGLFERRSGERVFKYHDLSKLENGITISNEVMNIVESERNGIWFLTNFGLYNAEPETGKLTRHGFDKNEGDVFISQDINSLYDDNTGTVWVGTWQGGLSRYRPETGEIKNYTRSDGLPSMGIQYILHDLKQDDLWLSTFDGISKFNISSEEFVNFTTDDGIHSQLFADGSGLLTNDGQFLFGGSGGYTFFTPENVMQRSIPPMVSLTGINVTNEKKKFEKGIQQAERVVLNHNENTLSIGFAAIHYSNPDRNKVRYILNNYDSDWYETGNHRLAYYPNIPPGNYHFKVIAANSNGIWNNEGAALEIQILYPWWRTWFAYGIYAILIMGGIYTVDQYQRKRLVRRERDRARQKELEQAQKIEKAYHNLEIAHENLKAAQDQLVQQEKLASLGQLTAGIAHEIKNPLNFVNNFSDLSVELIEEARRELSTLSGQLTQEEEMEVVSEALDILNNIEMNLKKIHEHGSRADSIVKSMLEHSRGGSGKKEPTDLNALVKEFTNLSFHGMRASKNPINVELKFELDESVGKVPLVAEDFSRVIVNLCNNAFDAMREKQTKKGEMNSKNSLSPEEIPLREGGRGPSKLGYDSSNEYEPRLTIRTHEKGSNITIEIEDNGPGIPEELKDKILQPFFTTKKGTQGTGLGLSISNDIVKAHGGTMSINSDQEKGTTFCISLPANVKT